MYRQLSLLAVVMTASLSQGCTAMRHSTVEPTAVLTPPRKTLLIAQRTEVPEEKDAPAVAGHPLTSVVITQCNLIVAVYMTMPDGKLLRFDSKASVPADELMQMAYSATRSERVEVACDDGNGALGAVGFEKHEPV
jgi:hypothetical protein